VGIQGQGEIDMQELSLFSQISLYVLLTLIGLLALIIWGWQIVVLRGKAMKNADGTICCLWSVSGSYGPTS
jgi:hypothetical protein